MQFPDTEAPVTSPNRWGQALTVAAGLMLVGTAVACLPGLDDGLVERLPSGVAAALPGWLRWGVADSVPLPKAAVVWTLAPLVIGLALCVRLDEGERRARLTSGAGLLWLTYVLLLVLSGMFSIVPLASREPTWTHAATLLAAMAAGLGLRRRGLTRVMGWVAGSAVFVALYAAAQHLGLDPLSWTPPALVRERSIGTLGNPDYLSAWLVGALPFAAAGMARAPGAGRRFAWGIGAGCILTATVFTYTRGAWVTLAVQAGVVIRLGWAGRGPGAPARREGWLAGGLAVAALGGLLFAATPRGASVGFAERAAHTVAPTDESSRARLALWREALDIAWHHPLLGTGPATFSYAAMPYRDRESPWLKARLAMPGDPHDELLSRLAASGVIAALILVFLVLTALRRLGRAARDDAEAAAPLVALVGLVVAHLFVQATVPSLLLTGCLLVWGLLEDREAPAAAKPASRTVGPVLAVVVLATAWCGWTAARALRADLRFNLAQQLGRLSFEREGASGVAYLKASLRSFDDAAAEASGYRASRIRLQKGKLLEGLFARSTPAMRSGSEGPFWQWVRDETLACYRGALEVNRLDPYVWHDLARFLLLETQGETAAKRNLMRDPVLSASLQGCRLDPYNAALWADHARRCAVLDHPVEAEAAFRRSLELSPQVWTTRLDFGRFLRRGGRRDAARQQLQATLLSNPDSREAREELLHLDAPRGKDDVQHRAH